MAVFIPTCLGCEKDINTKYQLNWVCSSRDMVIYIIKLQEGRF